MTTERMITRYVKIDGLCDYTQTSKKKAREIAANAGAVLRFGTRCTRYDLNLIDEYMNREGRKDQKGTLKK